MTDETPAQPACGARERGGPAVCNRPDGHPRDIHKQGSVLGTLAQWACEDDDVRPAAVADQAGETLDLDAIRARYEDAQPGRHPVQHAARKARESVADVPALLAQVERLTREYGNAADECRRHVTRIEELDRGNRTAVRERDEARAKVDGGEWQWGVRWTYGEDDGELETYTQWADSEQEARDHWAHLDCMGGGATLWRRPVGAPVEAVGDDGSGT